MMTDSYFIVAMATLLVTASVLMLRQSWQMRRRGGNSRSSRIVAWMVSGAGFGVWIMTTTPDWGTAVALCLFMVAGLAVILAAAMKEPRRQAVESGRGRPKTGEGVKARSLPIMVRRVGIFMLAGPVAGMAALMLALWVYGALFGGDGSRNPGQLFWTLAAFPVFWAILSLIATYDMPLVKRSGVVLGAAMLGFVGTYMAV